MDNHGAKLGKSISQGCKKDCMKLIHNVAATMLTFDKFVEQWHLMKFHQVFIHFHS